MADGSDDLFSYGPESQAHARSLGHLFVVGHTDQDGATVGYLVSLIAAMAKREYYASQPEGDAKEAFARTLRKVNEVVAEFFKTNEVGIDVGIFAVAGSSLYVSRLGKFRLLLSRNKQIVDVLNNVTLFNKEHVEKRRFSSIISGPVHTQDRLLAYVPQQVLARRERTIKQCLAASPQELTEKLSAIGDRTPSFSCSLLHIDVEQVAVQPPEAGAAAPTAHLAWAPRQGSAPAASSPEHAPPASDVSEEANGEPETQEVPRIIASEFSHRGRTTRLGRAVASLKIVRLGGHGKAIVLAVAALAVVGAALGIRSYLVGSETNELVNQQLQAATQQLKTVNMHISQDESAQARALILEQLRDLETLARGSDKDDITSLHATFLGTLNELDRARAGTLTLVATIDESEGYPALAATGSGSGDIWVLAREAGTEQPVLLRITNGVVAEARTLDSEPEILAAADLTVFLADDQEHAVTLLGDPARTSVLPTPDRLLAADWYNGNAYFLTNTGIIRVEDLDTVKPVTKQWLNDVSELTDGALRIAVDGDIWTLARDGTITKYYRGEKVDETKFPFSVTDSFRFMSSQEHSKLYVADPGLKRIHVIEKETMTLSHTITLDTKQSVRDIFFGPGNVLHVLAGDGKVWSVE